jgi:hemoglobin
MGEDRIAAMIEELYARLECSPIRSMFADDMQGASKRSAAFFVGLLGGPPLYQQRYGNPAMRARHLPFAIDEPARLVWLGCFEEVLEHAEQAFAFPPEHLPAFRAFLDAFSRWMVNTAPPQAQVDGETT